MKNYAVMSRAQTLTLQPLLGTPIDNESLLNRMKIVFCSLPGCKTERERGAVLGEVAKAFEIKGYFGLDRLKAMIQRLFTISENAVEIKKNGYRVGGKVLYNGKPATITKISECMLLVSIAFTNGPTVSALNPSSLNRPPLAEKSA